MSSEELKSIGCSLNVVVTDCFLTDFDTELDFSNRVR